MLPAALLLCSVRDGAVLPHWLGPEDELWLRELLDVCDAHVGRRQRELDAALRDAEPQDRRRRAWRAAARVLGRLQGTSREGALPPRQARAELFGAGAGRPAESERVVDEVARRLDVTAEELRESLFAALPGERRLLEPEERVSPHELALRVNLANVQGLLYRSSEVRLALVGNARRVVQHARLRGLICSVGRRAEAELGEAERALLQGEQALAVMRLSGPLSLFRRTLVYGRALASLVPQLAWCQRYRLRADVALPHGEGALVLQTGDAFLPASAPPRYDSKLEERFARDFRRAAPQWEAIREPEPFEAGRALVYPDFLLRHRRDPARRWYLEIAGFWTTDYLERKLARYRAAGLDRLILCIAEERGCSREELPPAARVLRYRRRVDVGEVLAVLGEVER